MYVCVCERERETLESGACACVRVRERDTGVRGVCAHGSVTSDSLRPHKL